MRLIRRDGNRCERVPISGICAQADHPLLASPDPEGRLKDQSIPERLGPGGMISNSCRWLRTWGSIGCHNQQKAGLMTFCHESLYIVGWEGRLFMLNRIILHHQFCLFVISRGVVSWLLLRGLSLSDQVHDQVGTCKDQNCQAALGFNGNPGFRFFLVSQFKEDPSLWWKTTP